MLYYKGARFHAELTRVVVCNAVHLSGIGSPIEAIMTPSRPLKLGRSDLPAIYSVEGDH